MKNFIFSFILSLIFIISCENNKSLSEDDLTKSSNGLKITIGSVCGWCTGGDSLVITENATTYTTYNYCDKSSSVEDTTTSSEEWAELLNNLDLNEFKKITINTCNVCVDGCDTWILVKKDTFSHRISFGYNDTVALQNIRLFVDKLKAIRSRF